MELNKVTVVFATDCSKEKETKDAVKKTLLSLPRVLLLDEYTNGFVFFHPSGMSYASKMIHTLQSAGYVVGASYRVDGVDASVLIVTKNTNTNRVKDKSFNELDSERAKNLF